MTKTRTATARPRILVPLGDPNGIGPEIALKAALDARVRAAARLELVGDASVIEACSQELGCADRLAKLVAAGDVAIDPVEALDGLPEPGAVTAAAGRAMLAYARHAIARALAGDGDAVVAAPHNETAVARAGIGFAGYPGLLAEATGTDPDKVFLMLVSPRHRIVHVTLHVALREALDAITTERVLSAACAADAALKDIGVSEPRIAACGINPHAGENGLFGDDDETIVRPAVGAARAHGIAIDGPAGADVLFAEARYDAYLAMFHDQGHIPIKLAGRGNSFGLSVGTPVRFSTVAHGSAHDIAGTGTADPAALIRTIIQMAETVGAPAAPEGS